MAKTQMSSGQAVAEVPSGFTDLRFDSPLMTLVQQVLGPFVSHKADCAGSLECSCGLKTAIADLQQREILVKRYGTAE